MVKDLPRKDGYLFTSYLNITGRSSPNDTSLSHFNRFNSTPQRYWSVNIFGTNQLLETPSREVRKHEAKNKVVKQLLDYVARRCTTQLRRQNINSADRETTTFQSLLDEHQNYHPNDGQIDSHFIWAMPIIINNSSNDNHRDRHHHPSSGIFSVCYPFSLIRLHFSFELSEHALLLPSRPVVRRNKLS